LVHATDLEALREALASYPVTHRLERTPDGLVMHAGAGHLEPAKVNRHCFEKGLELDRLVLRKKSLEARFLEVTDE